ncbi:MAG TPA: efflux RND transporter periplasmic adaptor subunit [Candidatus Limnocylindrales bacterium]|nr:efflux RND transporter periplasmic adaptor subunit [Candidatus Limnocylindrales bacterium]
MRLKVVAIVVLLVVAGGAVFASMGAFTPTASNATTLLTTAAAVQDVTDEIAATGTVEAVAKSFLAFGQAPVIVDGDSAEDGSQGGDATAASVTWPVATLTVKVGDVVTKGQTLATADTTDLEAKIADATRDAKSAALQLKQAQADRDDASTTQQRRQTQQALYNAQTTDAHAKASLADLEALRDHATLTAPAAGIVTAIAITAGADAPTGAAITLLSSELVVTTSVVESDIASIEVGQTATVDVSALDASLRGTVATIDPVGSGSGNGGVVSYAVQVALDAPPATLRPGMSADITITAASATNVLAIPSRALAGNAGSYTVRVVAADGTVSTRNVEVGLVTSSLAEIKSGLQAGDLVVTGTSSTQNTVTNGFGGGGLNGGGGGTVIRGTRP